MDGESSCDSDISESWSLIDVNLNEESMIPSENYLSENLEEFPPRETKNVNLNGSSEFESFPLKEEVEKDCNCKCSNADSNLCLNNAEPEITASCKECEDKDSEDGKSESCDGESIEILEADENDKDADNERLDISIINDIDFNRTDHSNDEESLCSENVEECSVNDTFATVIRRKRRKRNSLSESSTNSLNSNFNFFDKCVESHSTTERKNDYNLRVLFYKSSESVAQEQCKNFRNTILSLSLGIILAGITCIAISHFSGVYDAENASNNLMETVKKLQMENVALHSRLSHIDRAFTPREIDSNFGKSSNERDTNRLSIKLAESESISSNNEFFSERNRLIRDSGMNSIESSRDSAGESLSVDPGKIVGHEQHKMDDQLNILNGCGRREITSTGLEELNVKISRVLRKIVTRLSSSQNNLENLRQRWKKLRGKFNKKLKKIFSEEKNSNFENPLPVTEKDLLSLRWKNPNRSSKLDFSDQNSEGGKKEEEEEVVKKTRSSIVEFPQPESYYTEKKIDSAEGQIDSVKVCKDGNLVGRNNASESHEGNESASEKSEWKKANLDPGASSRNRGKKGLKFQRRKAESPGERGERVRGKQKKRIVKGKSKKNKIGGRGSGGRKKRGILGKSRGKNRKINFESQGEEGVEKLSGRKKKFLRRDSIETMGKRHSAFPFGRGSSRIEKSGFKRKADYSNATAKSWLFEWANGREEIRRHRAKGDWQFERARARKELRENFCY